MFIMVMYHRTITTQHTHLLINSVNFKQNKKEEFEAELHDECMNPIFRIILGKELNITPVEKVTTWKLS